MSEIGAILPQFLQKETKPGGICQQVKVEVGINPSS